MSSVTIRLGDRPSVVLLAGDLIGRGPGAALHVRDPRISEAHALVSLRQNVLFLLALRGRLQVDDAWCERIELQAGQRIALSPDTQLSVLDVRLPVATWTARFSDEEPVQLDGPRCWSRDQGWVSRGFNDADLRFWPEGDMWFWDRGRAPATRLAVGVIDTPRGPLHLERAPLEQVALAETQSVHRELPLEIIAAYDVVHFKRQGKHCGSIGGLGARLISELVLLDNARWTELTSLLWTGEPEALRSRLDNLIWRTRRRLSHLGIDPGLVSTDNNGLYHLRLGPHDTKVDAT